MITGNIVMMGQGEDHMYLYQKIISAQVNATRESHWPVKIFCKE